MIDFVKNTLAGIKRIVVNQPTVHFFIIAAAFFVFELSQRQDEEDNFIIEIDRQQVEWLVNTSKQQTGVMPSEFELSNLIMAYAQEEMLFREALALGMQEDDVIVRRRLAEKLRFLMESVSHRDSPELNELRTHFKENQSAFFIPESMSFVHVFFNADTSDSELKEAKNKLSENQQNEKTFGDPFMLGHQFLGRSQQQLAREFGQAFAAELQPLAIGNWSQPIRSQYGWHLVKVVDRKAGQLPDFEAVKPLVLAHWQKIKREEANAKALAQLNAKYQIKLVDGQG